MTDREKILHELDHQVADSDWCDNDWKDNVPIWMLRGALDLLREQEPLTVHDPGAVCPKCKWPLYPEDHPNYCGNCGRAVRWDG